jgi:hypothetical protein
VSATLPQAAPAGMLAALVDTLVPGDGGRWPSASQVGVHEVLPGRLAEVRGPKAIEDLAKVLDGCGGIGAGTDAAACIAVVARFEAEHAALFTLVRNAVYLAYYESPVVVDLIRAHGHLYQAVPHATGYPLPPFDADRDRPQHGRGHWIATEEVRRVDLSGLDFIAPTTPGDHG